MQTLDELYESWLNGNRKYVVDEILFHPVTVARFSAMLFNHNPTAYDSFITLLDNAFVHNSTAVIDNYLESKGVLASYWSVDDVREIASEYYELEQEITDEQAMEILKITEKNHDSSVGINHDSIMTSFEQYFGV